MTPDKKHQFWAQIFEQYRQSGLTVTVFCKEHQLTVSNFYYWRQKFNDKEPPQRAHPILLQNPQLPLNEQYVTLALPSGLTAQLPADLSTRQLQQWLDALLC